MEARLAARAAELASIPVLRIPIAPEPLSPTPAPVVVSTVAAVSAESPAEGLESEDSLPAVQGGEPAAWPDEAAESAFRAEARERGEVSTPSAPLPEVEETDPKGLPPLDSLVRRIPAPVMETLDDLFRARFVRVQKVPRRALKSGA